MNALWTEACGEAIGVPWLLASIAPNGALGRRARERRLQRGGHRYARYRGRILAGEQPGGVSGGDNDRPAT